MVAKAGSHLVAATALAVLTGAGLGAGSARAQNAACLASPNGAAPAGSHWYYKTDQATHQKCWYTRPQDEAAQAAPTQTAPSQAAPERGDAANPDTDAASPPEQSTAPVALAPAAAAPVQERTAPAAPRRMATPIARVPMPAADPRGEQPVATAATDGPPSAAMPSSAAAPSAPDNVAWPNPPSMPQLAGSSSPFPSPPADSLAADASSPPATPPAPTADGSPVTDSPTAAPTAAPDAGAQPTASPTDADGVAGKVDGGTPTAAKPPGRLSILLVMAGLIVLLVAGMLLRRIVESVLGRRRVIKLARQEPRLMEPIAVPPPPMPTVLRDTPSVVPGHGQTEQRASEVEDALRKLGQSLRQRRTAVNGLANGTMGRSGAAVRS